MLEKELKENDAERLFYDIEMPLVPVLVNIERNGVLLDTDALKQSSVHFTAQMQRIEQEIYELAGETFNIASPKQVGEVLFDKLKIIEKAKKTKTGQYVTSEEVLESLRHKHPVVEKILEHRGLKKLLGTYIDALPQLINPRTGPGTHILQPDCNLYRTPQFEQPEPAEYSYPRRERQRNPQGIHSGRRLSFLLCRLFADRTPYHGTSQRRQKYDRCLPQQS